MDKASVKKETGYIIYKEAQAQAQAQDERRLYLVSRVILILETTTH